jgi:hypothetical protein
MIPHLQSITDTFIASAKQISGVKALARVSWISADDIASPSPLSGESLARKIATIPLLAINLDEGVFVGGSGGSPFCLVEVPLSIAGWAGHQAPCCALT